MVTKDTKVDVYVINDRNNRVEEWYCSCNIKSLMRLLSLSHHDAVLRVIRQLSVGDVPDLHMGDTDKTVYRIYIAD